MGRNSLFEVAISSGSDLKSSRIRLCFTRMANIVEVEEGVSDKVFGDVTKVDLVSPRCAFDGDETKKDVTDSVFAGFVNGGDVTKDVILLFDRRLYLPLIVYFWIQLEYRKFTFNKF